MTAGPYNFPQRLVTPQISVFSRKEQSHSYSQAAAHSPQLVLVEEWAGASTTQFLLKRLWNAIQSGGNYPDPLEDKGVYNFWIDNDGTDGSAPAFSLSVAELFGYIYQGGVPATGTGSRMSRTSKGSYSSSSTYSGGAYRAMWMPAQRYMRVEYSNQAPAGDVSTFYNGTHVDHLSALSTTQQQYFQIFTASNAAQPARTPITVVDTSVSGPHGPGQLESVMLAWNPTGADAVLEGNVQIFTDNNDGLGYQLYYESSGGEDFFLGSWGLYGNSDPVVKSGGPGNAVCATRFFSDDPIYFAKDIKVVWWVGQPSQGTWADTTVPVKANAGVWFDSNPHSIKYWAPDLSNQLFFDDFNYPVGALPSASFTTNSTGTPFTSSGATYGSVVINDATASDRFLTVNSTYFTPPANYWVEARMRQGGWTSGTRNEIGLCGVAAGSTNLSHSSVVEVRTDSSVQTNMWISPRNGFSFVADELAGTGPTGGWSNSWMRVAMKVIGAGSANPVCYAYYRFDDPAVRQDSYWHPLGRWTHTLNNGGLLGLFAWCPNLAEVDYIRVYALKQFTS